MFEYGSGYLSCSKALQILSGKLKTSLNAESRERIRRSHQEVLTISEGEAAVYGINTGFGPLCNTRIDKSQTSELQRNLLLSHSVGVGKPIPEAYAKLMIILKVHSLAKGFSGISLDIIDRLLWHIEEDIIPVVPEQGSVGASGDLAPLSHLFLPLLGEGQVFYKNEIQDTDTVFQKLGIKAMTLPPKAGLALINGTQFILAHAVFLVAQLHQNLTHADLIAAMSIEGMLGSVMPFHPKLHETRPHPGNKHVAAKMYRFLQDSEIMASHHDCDRVQDPYSLRCVPQVHGSSRSAWLHLKEAVEIEMNSVTDNPIIFSKDFTISGGSFHGQPLALPLDYACLAAAELGSISDRRSYYLLEGKAEGVPKLLMKDTGLHSGFMILQYTSAALVSENKGLCFPSSADSIPTSLGQEDHVSMGSIGARKALQVNQNLTRVLAVELVCAAQAFDFRKPLRSGKTLDAIHAYIRKHIDHATHDRIFAKDIEKASDLLKSGALIQICQSLETQPFSDFDEKFEKY